MLFALLTFAAIAGEWIGEVPEGCSALLTLPGAKPREVGSGRWEVLLKDIESIDLSGATNAHAFVRRGSRTDYWGHPTTALLADGKTVYCVYPFHHAGRGGFLSVSEDGGLSWRDVSDRLPAIARRYACCPCIYNLKTPEGTDRLVYWQSFVAPDEHAALNATFVKAVSKDDTTAMPGCVSDDGGRSWRALAPLGPKFRNVIPFQGIVALKGRPGRYLGVFHRGDTGCFDGGHLEVLSATTEDGGLTWSDPKVIAEAPNLQLCEPWVFRSPEGDELCCLIRENGGTPAKMIFSRDEGETWTKPVDAPWFLNGHRHQGVMLADGRLAIVFRCVEKGYRHYGHFIAWIGPYAELKEGIVRSGCHIKLLHNYGAPADCGYAGIHRQPDGTLLATTYNVCAPDEKCSIVSVRFRPPRPSVRAR